MASAECNRRVAGDGDEDSFDYGQLGLTAEDYEFGRHLGDGGFGRVYQAVDKKTGREVAIKVLDKKKVHQRNMSSRVISEITIHQRLRHPFVLQLYSYFEDAANVYLVLELCHRGNLHDYVRNNGRLGEDKVRYFMKQIVTGLKYLHQNRIMHRDLTLANLLLTKDNRVKISDFGLATELSEDRTNKTMCGTPNYISPEVSSQGVQGLEVDVWSLGVMLYTMLVGKAPFDTKDPKSTIDNARRLKYETPGSLKPEAVDLIARLLRERPQDRLGLTDILEHPFMRKAGHERSGSNDSGNDSLRSRHRCSSGSSGCGQHSDSQGYVSAAHSEGSPLHAGPILPDRSCVSSPSNPRRHPSPTPPAPVGQLAEFSDVRSAVVNRAPLDTVRLEPCRLAKGTTVFTIDELGRLTVEQVRRRRGEERVLKLLRVSPDGRDVLFLPCVAAGDGRPLSDRPIEFDASEAESFVFPELSEQCDRLYQFAASFVAILRSNTPKVTMYTDRAKCVLYENRPEPDFSVHFYDGRRARRTSKCPLAIDGCPAQLSQLSSEDAELLNYVNEVHEQIRRVESVLSGVPGCSDSFPATVGRPPAANSSASSSSSTVSSSSAAELAVADLQQPTDADTVVLFNDGSRLQLRQELGHLRSLTFADSDGGRREYQSCAELPNTVQSRLRLLLKCPTAPRLTLLQAS